MLAQKKHKLSGKIWIEYNNKPLIGKGGATILKGIAEQGSISKAAITVGMSYRYVWNYIQKVENIVGESIVDTYKGGENGGGGAKLTKLGEQLLKEYSDLENYWSEILLDAKYLEVKRVKISARNRLKGKVISVEKDQINGKVKIEINVPAIVTAIITKEAIEDLGIKVGDEVEAIIKSSEVMIGK
jgi:molybdate transport system regulatory protein